MPEGFKHMILTKIFRHMSSHTPTNKHSKCIVLEVVCARHLYQTKGHKHSMYSVHINLPTQIPRFIPFQLRPIRARVTGSLQGKGRGVRRSASPITSSHWYAAECERETGTRGETHRQ